MSSSPYKPKSNTSQSIYRQERRAPLPNFAGNKGLNASSKDSSVAELKMFNGIIDGCHQNNHLNMAETKIKINL
jgi:hypothetical protein